MSEYANISPQKKAAAADNAALRQAVVEPGCKDIFSITAQRLPIQRKLSIGVVDDPLEHEADAMADTVMRMPQLNFIQRKCSHCEEEEAQRKPLASFIQKKESGTNNITSDSVNSQIQSTRGNGIAMPDNTKSFMESSFGNDFSNVKIHSGSYASQLSNELNAQAFTVGNDIYFNDGKFSPNSSEGKHLLAHELTHVVQNEKTVLPKTISRQELPEGANIAVAPQQLIQSRTPAEAALELLKRAHTYAGSGNHDKTKQLLEAVEQFMHKHNTPANFDKQFAGTSGISKTSARLFIDIAQDAPHRLLSEYRYGPQSKPSEGRWNHELNSFAAAVQYLNILTGTQDAKSAHVIQAVDSPIDYGAIYAEAKKAIYAGLIDSLKSFRTSIISNLRKQAGKLPPSFQPAANSFISVIDFVGDLFIGLILAVTGLIVGFVEGIVTTITGIIKIAFGIITFLADALLALVGRTDLLKEDLDKLSFMINNIGPGIKKLINTWWIKYQKASAEEQALMGGELVGEVVAFIATFAVAGAKAGDIPNIVVKIPYPSVQVSKVLIRTSTGLIQEVPKFNVVAQAVSVSANVASPAAAVAIASPLFSVGSGGGGGGSGKRRPTWQDSEMKVREYLGTDWQPQNVYRDGKLVERAKFGSVVPDYYNSNLKIAAEVKNYDLTREIKKLIEVLKDQGGGRMAFMPKGGKQWLFLDIRGQTITDLAGTALKIQTETGGSRIFEQVYYITDTGIQRII